MAGARSFIRKPPSGRYQARYWHLGRQIPADDTFATKTDARAWLASVETDLRRGERVNPAASYVQFGEYATEWRRVRSARGRVTPTNRNRLDLRHIAGTEAVSAGASLREVMARMGHASSSAALRYLKAAASRDRAIADAIGARLPNPSQRLTTVDTGLRLDS